MGLALDAQPVLEEAQRLFLSAGRADSLDYADILERLSFVGLRTGAFDESEAMQREALEIRGKLLGPDHKSIAEAYNNLGNVLRSKSDLDGAREAYDEAIRIGLLHTDGDRSRLPLFPLYNRAGIAVDIGDFEDAEPLLHQSLLILP